MDSCLVIGEDELTLHCADFLLQIGFEITFISPVLQIQTWCRSKGVICYENIHAILELKKYDYLFSIVNSTIIPGSFLKKIKKLAINYHDSLLPQFAGVNATPWALLSRSQKHGITWHVITERPDEGDIILQKRFSLKPEDTTVSVRTTCKNLAMSTFPVLVEQLMENSFTLIPQNLQNRTYYGLSKKPYGNALISWESPALDILTLHKALTFGNVINVLALPKFVGKDNIYIPFYVENTSNQSKEPPGTITKIGETHISVSSVTNDILIADLVTIDGKRISLSDFIRDNKIKIGSYLPNPTEEFLKKFEELSEKAAPFESKYLSLNKANILASEKTLFPHSSLNSNGQYSNFSHVEKVPPELIESIKNLVSSSSNVDEILLILSFLYLYQVNDFSSFPNLVYMTSPIIPKDYVDFFSQTAPLYLEIGPGEFFLEILKQGVSQFHFLKNHYYLKDINLRYSDYNKATLLLYSSVNFFFSKEKKAFTEGALSIDIDSKNLQVTFISNTNGFARNFSFSVIKNFSNWLNSIKEQRKDLKKIKINEIQLSDKKSNSYRPNEGVDFHGEFISTILELIGNIGEKKPNNVAIKHGERTLTYRDLLRQVNQLCHFLQPHVTPAQSRVILALPRSFDAIISTLAVLKLGAAYIPLDLNWPEERIKHILKDSKADVVLTYKKYSQFYKGFGLKVFELDEVRDQLRSELDNPLFVPIDPEQIAYIIYTSGSTGLPKGVLVPHRGLVNLAQAQSQLFEIDAQSRVLQFASLSFDAAVSEWSTTLSQGGCLCLLPEKDGKLTEDIVQVFQEESITVVTLPPSLAKILPTGSLKSLKTLVLAGEASSQSLVDEWVKHVKLINAYGPTEGTVCATAHVYKEGDVASLIGKPLPNIQVYLLNKANQLVPPGVIGEIVIGGIGVAKGYLNREDLTKKSFVPDFMQKKEDHYLYKTGDLARYREDGTIEYVGRTDHQVKLRGYRIELGEIEQALLSCRDIKEAVVLLREIKTGQKALVAYVEATEKHKEGIELLKDKLKTFVGNRLPGYMIPEHWIELNEWPLTVSGKIDRQVLLEVELEKKEGASQESDEPQSDIEKKLAALWCSVLRLEKVSIHDNFFRVGGDSISAIQLASAAKKGGMQLTAKDIFKDPILKSLAQFLEIANHSEVKLDSKKTLTTTLSNGEAAVKLHVQNNLDYPSQIENYYPLSPMQRGILLNYLQDKKQDWYFRQKIFVIRNLKEIRLFKEAWQEITKTHDIFKTAFFWQGLGDPIQFTSKSVPAVLDFHDISSLEKTEKSSCLERLLLKNREKKFELNKAPLIRGILLKYTEESYYFILTFHHILLDGWSAMELLETLRKNYKNLFEGRELEIKNGISFQQYITWIQQQDKTKANEFWKDYMFGSTYHNQFSIAFKRTGDSSKEYDVFEVFIPSLLYNQIVFLSRKFGLTLNSLMQFAWGVLLAKFTQTKDITFGITTFGRSIELENAHKVIGLLANAVPFRFQIKDDINIIQGINLIQEQLASIQHHALLPLFEIQSLIRGSAAHALFDTIFVFENYPKFARSKLIADLEINPHKNTLDVTEFPLTVGIEPSSELIMRFGYNKSYFSQENISKIFKDYIKIMEGICTNLDQQQKREKVA